MGEICVKGRHIFMGYLKNDQATEASFDGEGFYHTGDRGYLDPQTGNLNLSGRLKELIITSGGENVAPLPIELAIKDSCPIISNCVVVGDGERYLSVLLTLRLHVSKTTRTFTSELSRDVLLFLVTKLQSTAKTAEEAQRDPSVIKYIDTCIE